MTGRTLIPRKLLFGNPTRAMAHLSPDGRYLSYLAPLDGVLNLWVAPTDDPSAAKPITQERVRNIRFYEWAYTSRHVLYMQDANGDENWHVICVDVESGESRDLTPIQGVNAYINALSHFMPEEVLISINDRVPQLHDLYRVNLLTGERTLVLENTGFADIVTDKQFKVRLVQAPQPDGSFDVLQPDGQGGWQVWTRIPHEDTVTTQLYGFSADGNTLYLADSRGRDTSALFAVDMHSKAQTLIADDERADLSKVLMHPTENRPQAAGFTYDLLRWHVIDSALAEDFAYLQSFSRGELEVMSRAADDSRWIVAYNLDDAPARFYLYDRAARQAHFLFTNRPELENVPLSKMHPVIIPARDGLPLVSYLSLPKGSDTGQAGKPDSPLPMVLLVHGGPWWRDFWGYNPYHQLLADRGYAVLSVNFRGSTGFGKAFTNAGDGEWAGKMHQDLLDAVEWAIQQGVARRDKVAIMGGSYGGYATLVGLTFTPEVFACGVDIVGPSNLVTLLESVPPYWQPMLAMMRRRIGDETTPEGRAFLESRSPLSRADQIKRPLLIAQGANDPRVKQAESDQIVRAMQEKGIPVTYVLYPDEGHGFAREVNTLSFVALSEAFLSAHLGGDCEPFGDDLSRSSAQIVTGAEGVPNLSAR
ncbi:MAG: S9 family peptidase [Anaerolineae bacterium]|nr:S9 family peptidase [Anaerolineae bacterium]